MSEFVLVSGTAAQGGVTSKVRSEQTKSAFTVLELVLAGNASVPLHVHYREDEILVVMEGQCEIQHGGQTYSALVGTVVVLPKGQPHAFRNPTETPNRLLITAIPGGLDHYFDEINALGAQATAEQIDAINRKYEISFSPVVSE